jgi:gas vesicle protein
MPRQDTTDFLTAFAIGTVLGIGATLLLRPEPRTARERVLRELKPHRRKLRKSGARVRAGVREGAGATAEMTGEVITIGRELLGEFRAEVQRILEDARDELRDIAADGGRGARHVRRRVRGGLDRRFAERRHGERRGAGDDADEDGAGPDAADAGE